MELVSKAADLEATEVGAVERNHDILVQKSKVLAAKIGDLARTLKRQENSLTGSGKVPKTDLTTIQDDVESITNHWKQFKSAERIPDLKHENVELDDAYSKKLLDQRAQLRNRAQEAFDKAEREKVKSASLLQQAAKDDAEYKKELASEKQALAKLQTEKKAREEAAKQHKEQVLHQKLEARRRLQRQEQRQINQAVTQVKQDAKRRSEEAKEEKANLRSWGMAAQAASRGDAKAVGEFCEHQKSPAACRESLLTAHASAAGSEGHKPCDPNASDYLRCLGVRATGATLAGPSHVTEGMGDDDIARMVAQSGHKLMVDKTRRIRRLRNHNIHNKNWMSA